MGIVESLRARKFRKRHQKAVELQMQVFQWFNEEDVDPEIAGHACMMLCARIAIKMGKTRHDFGDLAREMYDGMVEVLRGEEEAS